MAGTCRLDLMREDERMAKKNNRKKSPSKIRYEQNNPTVSFRVSREPYDRLQAEGKSYVDILKTGLGLMDLHSTPSNSVALLRMSKTAG